MPPHGRIMAMDRRWCNARCLIQKVEIGSRFCEARFARRRKAGKIMLKEKI
jgi:hypothetical protein